MRPSNTSNGFALVVALLMMVVLGLLAFGAMFITQQNLKTAENIYGKALAKNHAEAGLEAARLVLANYYQVNGSFPSTTYFAGRPLKVTSPEGPYPFTLSDYQIDPSNPARVLVKATGTTLSGAKHTAEMLLDVSAGGGSVDPVFYAGLVAKGVVTNSGGIAPIIDGQIHGDAGYKLEVDFQTCTSRDVLTGLCTATTSLSSAYPLSAAQGLASYTCSVKPSWVDPCSGSKPSKLVDPVVLAAPDYNKVRDEANFNGHTLGDYLTNPLLCTHSFVPAIVPANAVICTSGDIDLSNKVIGTSSVIITDGKISSSGGANLTNVSLISKTSSISMSGGNTLTNVRFFSESGITLSGGTAVAGKSTVASGGNITLSGGTKPVEAIGSDGKTKVGIAIIGAGKIVLSGGSVYYGSIWGGSSVTLSGGTSVFGGIATTGDISLTGGAFVDTNVSVNNDELPKTDSKGLTVLSRR